MSDDRRTGDFVESVERAATIVFGIPIVGGIVGGLGTIVAFGLSFPFALYCGEEPIEFLTRDPAIFITFWLIGMVVAAIGLLTRNSCPKSVERACNLFLSCLFIVIGLATVIFLGLLYIVTQLRGDATAAM